MDWEQPCLEGLGDPGAWKAGCNSSVHAHFPQSQLYLDFKRVASRSKDCYVRVDPEMGHEEDQRPGIALLWRKALRVEAIHKTKLSGDFIVVFKYL